MGIAMIFGVKLQILKVFLPCSIAVDRAGSSTDFLILQTPNKAN